MMYYHSNARTITTESKTFKILSYIHKNVGATKYECVTNVLGLKGSKDLLRGYYSSIFRGWVDNDVLSPGSHKNGFKYTLTSNGIEMMKDAMLRSL